MYNVSYIRGHQVFFKCHTPEELEALPVAEDGSIVDEGSFYVDDRSPADISHPRPCARCGKEIPKNGADPCLSLIPNVRAACCGHGVEDPYYVTIAGQRCSCDGLATSRYDYCHFYYDENTKHFAQHANKKDYQAHHPFADIYRNILILGRSNSIDPDASATAMLMSPLKPIGKMAFDDRIPAKPSYRGSDIENYLKELRAKFLQKFNCGATESQLKFTLPNRRQAFVIAEQALKYDSDFNDTAQWFWTSEMFKYCPLVCEPKSWFHEYPAFDSETIVTRVLVIVDQSWLCDYNSAKIGNDLFASLNEFFNSLTTNS